MMIGINLYCTSVDAAVMDSAFGTQIPANTIFVTVKRQLCYIGHLMGGDIPIQKHILA